MRFDLETWGDDTTRLVHWDHLHGDDVIFILYDDGSACKKVVEPLGERLEAIDLISELYALARGRETT